MTRSGKKGITRVMETCFTRGNIYEIKHEISWRFERIACFISTKLPRIPWEKKHVFVTQNVITFPIVRIQHTANQYTHNHQRRSRIGACITLAVRRKGHIFWIMTYFSKMSHGANKTIWLRVEVLCGPWDTLERFYSTQRQHIHFKATTQPCRSHTVNQYILLSSYSWKFSIFNNDLSVPVDRSSPEFKCLKFLTNKLL